MEPLEIKKFIDCRMYPEERPREHDLVLVTVKRLQPDIAVIVSLDEYNDSEGTIYLTELTRQKRISSLTKLCPVGRTMVVEVVHSSPNFISLSKKHISAEDEAEYLRYYNLGKRLHGVFRRMAIKQQRPMSELCEAASWPLYRKIFTVETPKEKIELHPFNVLAKKNQILEMNLPEVIRDYLLDNHLDIFGEQIYTMSFLVHLMSYGMNGIEDIKNTFQRCFDEKENYPETTLEINMDECPKYTFKFSGLNKDQQILYMDTCKEIVSCFNTLGYCGDF